MKTKFLTSMTLSVICLTSGCMHNTPYYAYDNPPPNAPAMLPAQAQMDAKILGTLAVINKNEIMAAMEAQRKAHSPAVKNFAAQMQQAHQANLRETEIVGQKIGMMPERGPTAIMLEGKGRQEMRRLHHLSDSSFDKAYMTAMVQDHAEALHIINQKLLPQATNPLVRRHLDMTRAHVMHHLQQAKMIQKEMMRG